MHDRILDHHTPIIIVVGTRHKIESTIGHHEPKSFWADMVNIKQRKQLFETTTKTYQASISSWWFQPIWNILVNNHFPN